jgi:hypothetical protein
MLDPGYSLRAISVKRRQPNPWFKRGSVYRRAVDVLRTATEPLTARDIVERVLAAANLKRPDKAALAHLTGSILASLRNQKGNGIERTNEGAPARWRLKEVCRLATARPFCNRGLGELVGVAGARIV